MCSCAGFADGLLCSLISGGIYLSTLPSPGLCVGCGKWNERADSVSFPPHTTKSRLTLLCASVLRDLKLRNYTPEDEELKERQVPKAKPASGENS